MQAADGRIFVANTLGMLTFDGQEWGCHAVGNYTDVRSLCTDEAATVSMPAPSTSSAILLSTR